MQADSCGIFMSNPSPAISYLVLRVTVVLIGSWAPFQLKVQPSCLAMELQGENHCINIAVYIHTSAAAYPSDSDSYQLQTRCELGESVVNLYIIFFLWILNPH